MNLFKLLSKVYTGAGLTSDIVSCIELESQGCFVEKGGFLIVSSSSPSHDEKLFFAQKTFSFP